MTYEQILYKVVKDMIADYHNWAYTGYQAAYNKLLAHNIQQASFFIPTN